MIKLTPVGVDDEQMLLAKHIAVELCRHDFDSVLALPVAVGIMGAIQDAIDKDDINSAIKSLRRSWKHNDEFWLKHHSKSKMAKKIKDGLLPGSKKWLKTMGKAIGLDHVIELKGKK